MCIFNDEESQEGPNLKEEVGPLFPKVEDGSTEK